MKIRTDFVTNSSSSSFIFTADSPKLVKEAVARRLLVEPKDEWELHDYGLARRWAADVVGTPFGEHAIDDLREVYQWYRDELISRLLDVKYWEDWSERDNWKSQLRDALAAKELPEETKRKVAAVLTLDIYESILWNNDTREQKGEMIVIHQDFIEGYIWEHMSSWVVKEDLIDRFYSDNIDELMTYTKMFDGRSYADVMECLFEAKYLYFDDMETHYLICEALESAEFCLYSCGHMG